MLTWSNLILGQFLFWIISQSIFQCKSRSSVFPLTGSEGSASCRSIPVVRLIDEGSVCLCHCRWRPRYWHSVRKWSILLRDVMWGEEGGWRLRGKQWVRYPTGSYRIQKIKQETHLTVWPRLSSIFLRKHTEAGLSVSLSSCVPGELNPGPHVTVNVA